LGFPEKKKKIKNHGEGKGPGQSQEDNVKKKKFTKGEIDNQDVRKGNISKADKKEQGDRSTMALKIQTVQQKGTNHEAPLARKPYLGDKKKGEKKRAPPRQGKRNGVSKKENAGRKPFARGLSLGRRICWGKLAGGKPNAREWTELLESNSRWGARSEKKNAACRQGVNPARPQVTAPT